jgi:hypothetical protein
MIKWTAFGEVFGLIRLDALVVVAVITTSAAATIILLLTLIIKVIGNKNSKFGCYISDQILMKLFFIGF